MINRAAVMGWLFGATMAVVVWWNGSPTVHAQTPLGTAFIYQGALSNSSGSVTDSCDFTFALYNGATGTQRVGPLETRNGVGVANGIFVVQLDFGAVFGGAVRWLETTVRCPGSVGSFTTLTPRQPILSTPNALYAQTATLAKGAEGDFRVTNGILHSAVAPGSSEVAGALLLDNTTSGNRWSVSTRAAESDVLAFDFWNTALNTWRYGARLDEESNLTLRGRLTAGSIESGAITAGGVIESALPSDGTSAGALVLSNTTSGNQWAIPIRPEYADSLDFHFWDATAGTWRRPGRLENNGTLILQQQSSENVTLLDLRHPDVELKFHVDPMNHAEIVVYDPATQTYRWGVIDIDPATGNVGIGDNASSEFMLAVKNNAVIYTNNSGSGNLLELHHPKVQTYFHMDSTGHPEIGLRKLPEETHVWNVIDLDPQSGHVGVGGTARSEDRLTIYGSYTAYGTKAATVDAGEHGWRKFYATEAADVRLSDEGLAVLADGIARIDLDPVVASAIAQPYIIHLTPYADAALYVAETGDGYFIVKARDGEVAAQFAWRLSAPRRGYEQVRLESGRPPDPLPNQGHDQ